MMLPGRRVSRMPRALLDLSSDDNDDDKGVAYSHRCWLEDDDDRRSQDGRSRRCADDNESNNAGSNHAFPDGVPDGQSDDDGPDGRPHVNPADNNLDDMRSVFLLSSRSPTL